MNQCHFVKKNWSLPQSPTGTPKAHKFASGNPYGDSSLVRGSQFSLPLTREVARRSLDGRREILNEMTLVFERGAIYCLDYRRCIRQKRSDICSSQYAKRIMTQNTTDKNPWCFAIRLPNENIELLYLLKQLFRESVLGGGTKTVAGTIAWSRRFSIQSVPNTHI